MSAATGRWAVLLCAAFLAATLGGCGRDASPQQYLQEAKAFQAKHEYKAAIIQLKNALAQEPENGEARLLLGSAYAESGQFAFAEIELRRAERLHPDRAAVLAVLGRALAGQGKHDKVLDELAAFQQQGELSPELLTLQGNARLALRRPDAAASFEAALAKSPAFADAHLGLAGVAALAGKPDEALRRIDLALERSPGHRQAWLFKGDLLRGKAAFAAAEQAYRRAAELRPDDVQPHMRLANLYVQQGRLDAARAEVRTVREAEPANLAGLYQEAALDLREKKYAQTDQTIQQVLKVAPGHMKSVLLAGAAAHHLGKTELADKHLSAYLQRFPNDAYARKLLAANQLRANEPARALQTVDALLSGGGDAQALAIAGHAALRSNDTAKANGYLARAAALAPDNAALRTELGVGRLMAGDDRHGIADLEAAFRMTGSPPRADLLLIRTHLLRRDYDRALAAIAAFEKKQPQSPVVFDLRGLALLGQGNVAQARENFERALALQPDYFPAASHLARQDLREKNPEAARQRFVKLLEKAPGSVQALLALADLAAAAGDDRARVGWLEKAVQAAPKATAPRAALAQHYLATKDPQKALTAARDAQSANPDDPAALNLLGAVQFATGDKPGAATTYRLLVGKAPKSPLAHYRLALVQLDARDTAAARESLAKALALRPNYLDAQIALIALETKAGRHVEALKLAREVRSRDPKSPVGFVLEGDIRMAQEDPATAASAYEGALALTKNSALFIKLHDALVRAGRARQADVRAAEWLKDKATDEAPVRLYLAQVAMKDADPRIAIEHYQSVLVKTPDNVVALNNLAELYHEAKDPRALPLAERAHTLKPDDASTSDTLGWILLQQGDAARALPLLKEATAKAPGSTAARYHLAAGYAKLGDKVKAREVLDELLASKEPFTERTQALALHKQL